MSNTPFGIITNNTHRVFQRDVILGFTEVAAQHGRDVIIDALAENNPDHPRPVSLNPGQVDGVLAIANAAPDDFLRHLVQQGCPVALISHRVPDVSIPVVTFNNRQGIAELVRHLVERCDRRQLVFIRGVREQADAMQREQTFRQEMMRYNLPMPESHLIEGDFEPEIAAAALRRLLESGATFDGVISADYMMARAAIEVLRQAGIDVPGQVSVVGFGDGPEAKDAGLTTVAADVVELGRRAAYQLLGQARGLRISGVTVLSVQLVIRATCGCALTPA